MLNVKKLKKELHDKVFQFFFFEENNETTRRNLKSMLCVYFIKKRRKWGIKDVKIICDKRNNTKKVIESNSLAVSIIIKKKEN